MDVLIFKTSVQNQEDLQKMSLIFDNHPDIKKWSIDLDDWEKILRIETNQIKAAKVIEWLQTINVFATELE